MALPIAGQISLNDINYEIFGHYHTGLTTDTNLRNLSYYAEKNIPDGIDEFHGFDNADYQLIVVSSTTTADFQEIELAIQINNHTINPFEYIYHFYYDISYYVDMNIRGGISMCQGYNNPYNGSYPEIEPTQFDNPIIPNTHFGDIFNNTGISAVRYEVNGVIPNTNNFLYGEQLRLYIYNKPLVGNTSTIRYTINRIYYKIDMDTTEYDILPKTISDTSYESFINVTPPTMYYVLANNASNIYSVDENVEICITDNEYDFYNSQWNYPSYERYPKIEGTWHITFNYSLDKPNGGGDGNCFLHLGSAYKEPMSLVNPNPWTNFEFYSSPSGQTLYQYDFKPHDFGISGYGTYSQSGVTYETDLRIHYLPKIGSTGYYYYLDLMAAIKLSDLSLSAETTTYHARFEVTELYFQPLNTTLKWYATLLPSAHERITSNIFERTITFNHYEPIYPVLSYEFVEIPSTVYEDTISYSGETAFRINVESGTFSPTGKCIFVIDFNLQNFDSNLCKFSIGYNTPYDGVEENVTTWYPEFYEANSITPDIYGTSFQCTGTTTQETRLKFEMNSTGVIIPRGVYIYANCSMIVYYPDFDNHPEVYEYYTNTGYESKITYFEKLKDVV